MKNLRKTLVVLLVLAMVLSICACGQKAETPSAPAGDAPAEAKSNEKITIEFWHRASADQGLGAIESAAEAFNNSQDRFVVKPVYNSGEYRGLIQSLVAEAASGNTPAIAQIAWAWTDYFANNFPVTDIKTLENGPEYLKEFEESIVEVATVNDTVVGLPFALSTPIFYYNVELCTAAGLDVNNLPTTWDEVAEWAHAIAEKTDAEGFCLAAPQDFWGDEYLLDSFGCTSLFEVNSNETYAATFNNEDGVKALSFVADLYKRGDGIYLAGADALKEAFASGKLGITCATCSWSAGFTQTCDFEFVTTSVVSDGVHAVTAPAGGAMLCITATDPDQIEGAWEFMQFLTADEYLLQWCETTGYLPAKPSVRNSAEYAAYLAEKPYIVPAVNFVPNISAPSLFPGESNLTIQAKLCDMRDAIYTGQKDAVTATNELAKEANILMNES